MVREASPPSGGSPNPAPAVSSSTTTAAAAADTNKAGSGRGSNSKKNAKSSKKVRNPPALPTTATAKPVVPSWISAPVPTPTSVAKRSTTPSPTMSSSSQRSQSPPPPPPSPPVVSIQPVKVITTKEETRLFKQKPKKAKNAKAAGEETRKEVVSKKDSVPVQPTQSLGSGDEKRTRSSSVPSNNRNKGAKVGKNAENDVTLTSTTAASPPVATPISVPASTTPPPAKKETSEPPATTVWQPRAPAAPLAKTTNSASGSTGKPQPPVGKILPEVRRGPEHNQDAHLAALPKPIGYRHALLEKKPSPTWNAERSPTSSGPSWFTAPLSPPSGAWWPDDSSLFSRERDWFGLRSLASDLTTTPTMTTASSLGIGGQGHHQSMWPSSTGFPAARMAPSATADAPTWSSEIQTRNTNNSSMNTGTPAVSRVYSPWSVPHWLDVTQPRQPQQQPQQQPAEASLPSVGLLGSGLWDPSRNNNNGTSSGPESWNLDYSQF